MPSAFRLVSPFEPQGDQPRAIRQLVDGVRQDLEELRAFPDRTVYLLEPWEGSWDSPQVLEAHAEEIFDRELEEWVTDRERWPRNRNFAAFQQWFEVEPCSAVVDLVGGPL